MSGVGIGCEIMLLVFPTCHFLFPKFFYGAGVYKVKLLLFQKVAKTILFIGKIRSILGTVKCRFPFTSQKGQQAEKSCKINQILDTKSKTVEMTAKDEWILCGFLSTSGN